MASSGQKRFLLITDVDDTTLGDRPAVERFARWHRSVSDRLAIVYASGRFATSVAESIRTTALPQPAAIIGGVGSEICHYPGLEPLEEWTRTIRGQWSADGVRDALERVDDLRLQPDEAQSPFKVSYFVDSPSEFRPAAIHSKLRESGLEASVVYSSGRDLDVLPSGVDKGTAARFLADHWAYDADHVIVAGNSENDAALYRHGFRGVVVGNAHDRLKELAGSVVYLSRESFADGVREGIAHWTGWSAVSGPLAESGTSHPTETAKPTRGEPPDRARRADGYDRAVGLLHESRSDAGFLASTTERDNYHRIWARDGCVMGLAALMSGEPDLIGACRETLVTLAKHQGPHGEIPSNVDPTVGRVSYGGTAGRVDADLWFVIACGRYWRETRDEEFLDKMREPLERVRFLLGCWQFNARGLLYVPLTGDWADEYAHNGYVLYDQLLYLQSLRELGTIHAHLDGGPDHALDDEAARLRHLIRTNYWFDGEDDRSEDVYHPTLYEKGSKARGHSAGRHWLPFFSPAGYGYRFDTMANTLASLVDVAQSREREAVDEFVSDAVVDEDVMLLPAFFPVITPRDEAWDDLQMMFSYSFKNEPHEYHNGGLWPMVTGFYAADLAQRGKTALARSYLEGIHRANASESHGTPWSFPEFLHGRHHTPGGARRLGWSAAAAVIAAHAIDGGRVF